MAQQHVAVKGLVIRQTDFGDHDRYITLLTEELGKIEVLCRGIRRKRGRLVTATSLFQYSEFTLFAGRQYQLNDAVIDTAFWSGITGNIEYYALCCYFADLANIAAVEEQTAKQILRLVLRALYALDRQHRQPQAVKAAFELRLACLLGFQPELGSARPLFVLPGCCLGGAAFCLLCDLIARSLFAPTELSISAVTAVFGAPVVIWLLIRRNQEGAR